MPPISKRAISLHFYPTSQQAWLAMYSDCRQAQQSISIEQYIFNDDLVGRRFMRLFTRKASEGVSIRLILDGLGSRGLLGSKAINDFEQAGGKVHFYNRPHWYGLPLFHRWLPRDHAKTLTVDDHIGYVGSVCVAGYMRGWRELHTRITGGLIADIKSDFNRFWSSLVAARPHHPRSLRYLPWRAIQYIAKHPSLQVNPIYRHLLRRLKYAQDRVLIASPFFVPPRGLRRALYRAQARGAQVTLLVSHTSDVSFVDKVSRSYLPELLRCGIDVRLYRPTVFHAKYIVVDDDWAVVGSTNIDLLSILQNREASLVIADPAAVTQIADHFIGDLRDSVSATADDWYGLPWHSRLTGHVGRLFRRVL